jgi:DnaK suppressor protein
VLEATMMNHKKRHHFKKLLLAELRRHAQHINDEQARALDIANDDLQQSSDLAVRDVIQELALQLSDHESKIVADIDQALMRMNEGSYGMCVRCGHEIDERRLEALPTARYDAVCQAEIETAKGQGAGPSL